MVKVSIIVPVYNSEKYLKKCIESIQKQTLKDMQIILINDGSTDNSLSICKEYQKRDNRIEVIDKANMGVSSARNTGIEAAIGEYIGFVDADDWIEPEMYENMYHQVKQMQADVCMCNYVVENNRGSTPVLLELKQNLLQRNEIINDIIANMIAGPDLNSNSQFIMGSVWRLLIKKEIIDSYNIRFQIGIPYMEDFLFCLQVLLKSNKVCIDEGTYYHYNNTNLSSATKSYKKDLAKIQRQVFETIEKILEKEKVYSALKYRMDIRYVNMCIDLINNELHEANDKSILEKLKVISEICRDERLKKILSTIDTSGYTLRKKMVLAAIKHGLGIYLYIYYSIVRKANR